MKWKSCCLFLVFSFALGCSSAQVRLADYKHEQRLLLMDIQIALMLLGELGADVIETHYLGPQEFATDQPVTISNSSSKPCTLQLDIIEQAGGDSQVVSYDFTSADTLISTDFWGAGADWSLTLSYGGEDGWHVTLFYRNAESQDQALSAFRQIRHACFSP